MAHGEAQSRPASAAGARSGLHPPSPPVGGSWVLLGLRGGSGGGCWWGCAKRSLSFLVYSDRLASERGRENDCLVLGNDCLALSPDRLRCGAPVLSVVGAELLVWAPAGVVGMRRVLVALCGGSTTWSPVSSGSPPAAL
jgi:hypothetical protein